MGVEGTLCQRTLDASFKRATPSSKRKALTDVDHCDNEPRMSKRHKSDESDPEQSNRLVLSQKSPSAEIQVPKPKQSLNVKEETGDIFDAPSNTLLIHSCNCQGSWHAGIADAFRKRYPQAFEQYSEHCKAEKKARTLVGTALLIPPPASASKSKTYSKSKPPSKHFIGCFFTSYCYGKGKDNPAQILKATESAMRSLLQQAKDWNATHEAEDRIHELRMCKINSGLFAVPWARTKMVLEGIDVSELDVKQVLVVFRD